MTQKITRTQFSMVPIELAEACADHKGWLFVYIWLWHYAGRDDQAFPSVERLAVECRMKPADVRRALAWLYEAGWINRIDRPGRTTLYHVRSERLEQKPRARKGSQQTPPPNGLGVTPPPNGVSPKRATPPPNGLGVPLPQMGYPSPKRPLPQMGEGNKKEINPRTKTKNQLPNPPSLREGPPFPPLALGGVVAEEQAAVEHAPPVAAPHRQETTETIETCNLEPHPSPATPGRPEKEPEQADGCLHTGTVVRKASQALTGASSLPDYARPYRENLVAWYRVRQQRHKAQPNTGLTTRSLTALAYAHERGVLEEFTQLAAEAGWLSLGFNGYKNYIDQLCTDGNAQTLHSRSGTLRSTGGVTTRQQQAAMGAIAFFERASQESNPFNAALSNDHC